MTEESTIKRKRYRLELLVDEEGHNITVVGGDTYPCQQDGAEPAFPGWSILRKKLERPVVCVGIESLAVLFQGGTVNLNDAVLIPDSHISNAARHALNERRPEMQHSQN